MSVRLCLLSELPDGGAAECWHDGESVVVLRQGDRVDAYWNQCPHAGRALNWAPGRFLCKAGQLICAAHGATFDVASGRCVDGPARGESLRRLAVTLSGDEVMVE